MGMMGWGGGLLGMMVKNKVLLIFEEILGKLIRSVAALHEN